MGFHIRDSSPEDLFKKNRILPFQLNHERSLSNNSNYMSANHNPNKAEKKVGAFRLPMIDRENEVARSMFHFYLENAQSTNLES